MHAKLRSILVTGGAGFIGSAFVRYACKHNHKIIVVDKLTYAGDLARLKEVKGKFIFLRADICDKNRIEKIIQKYKPSSIVHFAAETHVDRSIVDPTAFIDTNIKGTQVLLDLSKKYAIKSFIHISTDEVYGEIEKGRFTEDSPLSPNSPYAASKAAADLLIKSYIRTYGLAAIIIRPSNNYGPWQFPEKLIPLAIRNVICGKKIPVYAKGENVREWLYVEDCARGIYAIFQKGKPGQIYNLGSNCQKMNIQVVKTLLKLLYKPETLIAFVKDRPGHDIRYCLGTKKIRKETGWQPQVSFKEGLSNTVAWCKKNQRWLCNK